MKINRNLLFVFGEGGHTEQACRLHKLLVEYNHEFEVDALTSIQNFSLEGFKEKNMLLEVPKDQTWVFGITACLGNVALTLFYVKKLIKAKKIIIFGPGLCISTLILGALFFRKKIIVFESWSRFESKSKTVRLAELLCVNIIYQNNVDANRKSYGRLG